jgi:hypothetical protein
MYFSYVMAVYSQKLQLIRVLRFPALYSFDTATKTLSLFTVSTKGLLGYAVVQLVETLRYKPEGRWFDFRWSHWNFSVS